MFRRKNIWLRLGLLALALRLIFAWFPKLADTIYRDLLFNAVRSFWDATFGRIPLPSVILIGAGFILWFVFRGRFYLRWLGPRVAINAALNVLGFTYFWFTILWGFNYQASDLFADSSDVELNKTQLIELCAHVSSEIEDEVSDLNQLEPIQPHEDECRRALEFELAARDWHVTGNVRCRVVSSSGWLRRIGIAGIYWPFSGEGHIDDSYLFSTKVFSLTHELSHGYGITDEGEANYLAFVSLMGMKRKYQVCAMLELLRDALIELRGIDYESYENIRNTLPKSIALKLDELNENARAYPPYFPGMAQFSNDIYLKVQGVEDGVQSYNQYIARVYQYLENLPTAPTSGN